MSEFDTVVRPAAVITDTAARRVVRHLERNDIQFGGSTGCRSPSTA